MTLASLPAIRRLLVAEMTCPDFHPTPGAEVEVFAYLVEHPDGAVLVDTGIGSDRARSRTGPGRARSSVR